VCRAPAHVDDTSDRAKAGVLSAREPVKSKSSASRRDDQAFRPSRPNRRTSSGAPGPVTIRELNMPDPASKPAFASVRGSSSATASGSSPSSCPMAGRGPGVDGEVSGQLQDVLLPGGVAEGHVHGPLEGFRLRHRRVCLLHGGRQQSRPRRGVVAHQACLKPVAGVLDRQAFQQRRHSALPAMRSPSADGDAGTQLIMTRILAAGTATSCHPRAAQSMIPQTAGQMVMAARSSKPQRRRCRQGGPWRCRSGRGGDSARIHENQRRASLPCRVSEVTAGRPSQIFLVTSGRR